MNMRIDSASATSAASIKAASADSKEVTYYIDDSGLSGGGGGASTSSSNEELVKFYEAETTENSGTTESKSGLLTAGSDFSKIKLQSQNTSNLLSQNTVVSADIKTLDTPILVAEQTDTSLPTVIADATTAVSDFPNTSAQNAFSSIFPNGSFDQAGFDKFLSTVLKGKSDTDTISWGELNDLGNALGFEGNADLRNGSAIDAMMAHPTLGPALRALDPRQEKISVSGLKEALKNAFGIPTAPTYAPVTFTAAGYSSVLKSGKDSITGSYQAWKEMTLNGKLSLTRVVRFLDNAIGGKTSLNNADLAGIAQKLGFDTLDTMLWHKNADGSDGLGKFLNQYRDASGTYNVPSDEFIAKYSNMLETAAGADGVSALDYNEYKALLSDAYLFDTQTPPHVDGLSDINMSDATALTKFISLVSGSQGGLNVPVDKNGNLVLTDANGQSKPIMAGAYAMAILAKQLGYPSLDAMMKSPALQNILGAANENKGIKGYININLNTLINGSDTGIVHVQGLSQIFKTAAGSDNVLSDVERAGVINGTTVDDTQPVITPVTSLPIGIAQANAADFKTTIRNYLITKAREYDTDSNVTINANGSVSGFISKDAMDKIGKDMGFTGGLEQMKTHPELKSLLEGSVDNGGITGKLERYDISKLANGVSGQSVGFPDILLSAAHSDLTLSAADMTSFIALSGTGGIKPIPVPDYINVSGGSNFDDVIKAAGFSKVANPQDYDVPTGTNVYLLNGKAYKAVEESSTNSVPPTVNFKISEVQLKSTTTPVDPTKIKWTFPNIKPLARLDKELTSKGYTKIENPTDYGVVDGRPVYMLGNQAYVFTATRPNGVNGVVTFTSELVDRVDHAPPVDVPTPETSTLPTDLQSLNGVPMTSSLADALYAKGYVLAGVSAAGNPVYVNSAAPTKLRYFEMVPTNGGINPAYHAVSINETTAPAKSASLSEQLKSLSFDQAKQLLKAKGFGEPFLIRAPIDPLGGSSAGYRFTDLSNLNHVVDVNVLLSGIANDPTANHVGSAEESIGDPGPIGQTPPWSPVPTPTPINNIFTDATSGGSLDELIGKINDKLIAGAKSIPVTVSDKGDGTLNVDQLAAFMKKLAPDIFTDLDKVLLHPDLKDLISAAKIAGTSPVQYDLKQLTSGLSALLGKAAAPGDPSTLSLEEKNAFFKKTITVGTETPPIIAVPPVITPTVPPTTLTPLQQAQWNMLAANLKRRNITFDPTSSIEQLRALVSTGARVFRSNGGGNITSK